MMTLSTLQQTMFFIFILPLLQSLSATEFNGCSLMPETAMLPESPVQRHNLFHIVCPDLNLSVQTCIFTHYGPYDVEGIDEPTVCIASRGEWFHSCPDDTRIYTDFEQNTCGMRVILSEPDDMGIWSVQMLSFEDGQLSSVEEDIMVYTFNRTVPTLEEEEIEIGTTLDVSYNYDDCNNTWLEGQTGWERHDIVCKAQYGSPAPNISWHIDLWGDIKDGSTFRIQDGVGASHDPDGLVVDQMSLLSFEVNNDFLNELQDTYHIDTNPQTGTFEFDLWCKAYQGEDYGGFFGEMSSTRIVVHRKPGTPWC